MSAQFPIPDKALVGRQIRLDGAEDEAPAPNWPLPEVFADPPAAGEAGVLADLAALEREGWGTWA